GGLGSSTSKQIGDTSGSYDGNDDNTQQVIQGAVSGVYAQLYGLANKMQGTMSDKNQLENIEAIYNNALANGTFPLSVPVYNISFDPNTGQFSCTLANPPTQSMTKDQLQAAKDNIDQTKDSMSDMSTMDQLNLQQLMEQKSQFEQIFSNMLKS